MHLHVAAYSSVIGRSILITPKAPSTDAQLCKGCKKLVMLSTLYSVLSVLELLLTTAQMED